MTSSLTLGVEEELHVVDLETSLLVPRAPQLLARLPAESFSAELQRSTIETNTEVCTTLDELHSEIVRLRRELISVVGSEGLGVAAVGTAPLSSADDFELTATGRFGRMQEEYRLLVDEQLICGTQVHVGLADRDVAVSVAQRVSRDLPTLLSLSASSPFWHGTDTGYASIRTIIWQRWPTAGTFGELTSASQYDDLVSDLISSGVIADAKMAYFDVRPSSHVPTIELRVCDGCPIVDDAVLIAGLFRGLVAEAQAAAIAGEPIVPLPAPLHRAAMWRAARSGLAGDLLDNSPRPQPVPAAQVVRALVNRLRPHLEELGDWSTVVELAEATLIRGNSADRQRAAFAEHGRMSDVVDQVVGETHGTIEDSARARKGIRRYPARAGDEVFMASGEPRPPYREVLKELEQTTLSEAAEQAAQRDEWSVAQGMTFGVDGGHRPFPVDLLPRVIPAHEWTALRAGLAQRARAIEAFLQDIYSDEKVLDEAVLPSDVVRGAIGWREEARRLPRGVLRAPVQGFDLVRNELGAWRVLEDNVRVPSGAGFALAIRELMDVVVPGLPRPEHLLAPASLPALLRSCLQACAAPGATGTLALLSDGAGNSAFFEHRLLAERAELLLATPEQLEVVDGRVVYVPTGAEIAVLYLRLDVELLDLVDSDGRAIGSDLLEAAVADTVRLANAPGNGVADDKAMYCYVSDLIAYYLGEKPLLDSVPTYRCSDPEECRSVLERVGELVTKPVDGYGGGGVMVGPLASAAAVSARRAEVAADPPRWVAQEVVALSSHPTFNGANLEPRHVDLRAFVYLTGTEPEDAHVADLALTRVAPAGSMVVNSSRGGGAKDTWIIGEDDHR
ncbi:carboxylate-amine ligase [Jatrophihabitans sp. GAS493]|uniref:glutamate--cysteine ligase n=1 Tax=Jatrophihabitans sp. GAS493 TaxID=1907575 RepID=UPI000BBFAD34|nr:glutamate--cysteine ligase [Jatrophihabitans sp. GAS493]SOD70847.1 carboxylate-amine ligase [Jatrophihabitans sp. GAS493]